MTSAARPGAGRRPAKGRISDMADGGWRMAEGRAQFYSASPIAHYASPAAGRRRNDVARHGQPAPAQDSSHHQAGDESGQDAHEQRLVAQGAEIARFDAAIERGVARDLLAAGGAPGQLDALA